MNKLTAESILKALRAEFRKFDVEEFTVLKAVQSKNPFQILVAVVLSQNTSDKNSLKAFNNLTDKLVNITPWRIIETPLEELEEIIKPAGIHKKRAEALRKISMEIIRRYNGDLSRILKLPPEDIRRELMKLPQVGAKTADVLILFLKGGYTIPIDTHLNRLSKRIGYVNSKAGYEEIRGKLMNLFKPEEYLEVHLLHILLGRKYCKAKKPKCKVCPIVGYCRYEFKVIQ